MDTPVWFREETPKLYHSRVMKTQAIAFGGRLSDQAKAGGFEWLELRVIRVHLEIGKQQRFPAWLAALAVWLQSHEHRINLAEAVGIIEFQDPTLLCCHILI